MAVIEIQSEETYYETIKSSGIVVVDYFATWCGPCKMIAPKFTVMSNEYTNVKFCKIDTGDFEELAEKEDITSMPTFKVFVDGALKKTIIGANIDKIIAAVEEVGGVKGGAAPAAAPAVAPASAAPATAASATAPAATAAPAATGIIEVKKNDDFKRVLAAPVAVVDFYATWCGPCKMVAPKFKELSVKYGPQGVAFAKVDVEEMEELAEEAGVQSLPTFMVFKNGKRVETVMGANIDKVQASIDANLGKATESGVENVATMPSVSEKKNVSISEDKNVTRILEDTRCAVADIAEEAVTAPVAPVARASAPMIPSRSYDEKPSLKRKIDIPPVPATLAPILTALSKQPHAVLVFSSRLHSLSASDVEKIAEVRTAATNVPIGVVEVDVNDVELNAEFDITENALPVVKTVYKGVVYRTVVNADVNEVERRIAELVTL